MACGAASRLNSNIAPPGATGGSYNSMLIYYLTAYLGQPPDNTLRYSKPFICPGFVNWLPNSGLSNAATFVEYAVPSSGNADGRGGSDVWGPGQPPLPWPIFGYEPSYGTRHPSQKLSSISALRSLTEV